MHGLVPRPFWAVWLNGIRSGTAAASGMAQRSARGLLDATRRVAVGLPGKLLVLTLLFVMLAEVLIFVPSVSNFRANWLMDRLQAARLASLAASAGDGGVVPEELRTELLNSAGVQAIAVKEQDIRRLILPAGIPLTIDASFDLRRGTEAGLLEFLSRRLDMIRDALYVFVGPKDRMIRVYSQMVPTARPNDYVEVILEENKLRAAMVEYALNILMLSIIISIITATLVYFALSRVLVAPILALSRNMVQFGADPEDHERIIKPSGRLDEIGAAERELARMQTQLAQALNQKNRLAQLGLAVSKINHDLRNMLASAQLLSDRLSEVPDPTVQRFTPKLIASLDRAINFCNDTLKFGRAEEAPPRRDVFPLAPLVHEIADGLQLPRSNIDWFVDVPDGVSVDADREHLFRALNNLVRNAIDAIEQQGSDDGQIMVVAERRGRATAIRVIDNGPGVPAKARNNLFKAFKGNARPGGVGLGLAIASELIRAHGGHIQLIDTQRHMGAMFEVLIPDRGVRLHE